MSRWQLNQELEQNAEISPYVAVTSAAQRRQKGELEGAKIRFRCEETAVFLSFLT